MAARRSALGLDPGDIIASLNSKPIDSVAQLQRWRSPRRSGPWTVAVRAQATKLSVTVTVR